VRIGANVVMATLDQQRESLDPTKSVTDTLTGGAGDSIMVGGRSRHVVGYLKDFLFPPAQARTPVGVLSGGERGRLMLARALAKPANMLVLDEPTNDLDLETLDMLQEMLADYAGTVLLISHDRDFLDRVVNGVIVPEGNGRWNEYAGGYSDMLAQRGADLVRERAEPAKPGPADTVAEDIPVRAARPTKRRLSFNEKHALEKLPGEISALRTKIGALHGRLSDPNLYARERVAFEQASAELAAAEKDLAAAEERWLELEILREDVAGQ
jgi:ATP-binding cassette subfamily F protein uup